MILGVPLFSESSICSPQDSIFFCPQIGEDGLFSSTMYPHLNDFDFTKTNPLFYPPPPPKKKKRNNFGSNLGKTIQPLRNKGIPEHSPQVPWFAIFVWPKRLRIRGHCGNPLPHGPQRGSAWSRRWCLWHFYGILATHGETTKESRLVARDRWMAFRGGDVTHGPC